jgi:hypothetical protein
MSPWSHSICETCFQKEQPGQDPVRLKIPEPETCCFCGNLHESGIYYRKDPQLTLCKGAHKGEED